MSGHFLCRALPNLALIRVSDFKVSHPILQLRRHHGAIQVGLGHSLLSFGHSRGKAGYTSGLTYSGQSKRD